MSSTSKGKKREQELVRKIDDRPGWTAERIPRSVADARPLEGDVLAYPAELEVREQDHAHHPIASRLESGELDRSDVLEIEVKWRSSGQSIKGLYQAHRDTVGLGYSKIFLMWSDGMRSGGLPVWTNLESGPQRGVGGPVDCMRIDDTPASWPRKAAEGVDAAAFRMSRAPWVLLWQMEGSSG